MPASTRAPVQVILFSGVLAGLACSGSRTVRDAATNAASDGNPRDVSAWEDALDGNAPDLWIRDGAPNHTIDLAPLVPPDAGQDAPPASSDVSDGAVDANADAAPDSGCPSAPAAGGGGLIPSVGNFGTVPINTLSAPIVFTTFNSGRSHTSTISTAIEGSTQFKIMSDTCAGQNLEAGQKCEVAVQFAPTIRSNATGLLVLKTAGPCMMQAQANLLGTAG